MKRQRSRVWRAAEYIGLIEEPSAAPRRGSTAWWQRGLLILVAIVVFAVVKVLVS